MKIEKILAEIEQAYPEDIFPPTTEGEREDVMERYPGFIDRTSASMGRHLVRVIREKLAEKDCDCLFLIDGKHDPDCPSLDWRSS